MNWINRYWQLPNRLIVLSVYCLTIGHPGLVFGKTNEKMVYEADLSAAESGMDRREKWDGLFSAWYMKQLADDRSWHQSELRFNEAMWKLVGEMETTITSYHSVWGRSDKFSPVPRSSGVSHLDRTYTIAAECYKLYHLYACSIWAAKHVKSTQLHVTPSESGCFSARSLWIPMRWLPYSLGLQLCNEHRDNAVGFNKYPPKQLLSVLFFLQALGGIHSASKGQQCFINLLEEKR